METAQSGLVDLQSKKSKRIGHRILYIQCQQIRGDGQKFFKIYVSKRGDKYDLPNILVPQEAYKFVDAWDKVIRQLPMEEPTHPEGDESPLVLATQTVADSQHYDFKLSAWHKEGGAWHFHIQSVPTSEEYNESKVYFPISALPWLRKQMVRMLAEHDGSKSIDEMPTIPEWATRAAPKIKQQKQQSNVEQEQVKEKKADDAGAGDDEGLSVLRQRGMLVAPDDIEQTDKSPTIPAWATLANDATTHHHVMTHEACRK